MAREIPFNRPYMTGKELNNIRQAHKNRHLSGDGLFTERCHKWLERETGASKAFLTHSCTAALEMTALLLDLKPGDEVIMPSFTFVSSANAFALRGAVPVFVDIREDTLNLDESKVEQAVTDRTRAILPVHYAGVGCEMDTICEIARRHDLAVIEDAAQGIMSSYKERPLGSIGSFGTLSFHETKNVIAGEGGALLVNDEEALLKAEIIREKGTDRSQFFRGEVDKYTWQMLGSSYLPGEIVAAFLEAQLYQAEWITSNRMSSWAQYHELLTPLENAGLLRRPVIPAHCRHNAHMYYVILAKGIDRQKLLQKLNSTGINALSHYVPLHESPAGKLLGRIADRLLVTEDSSSRLIRLPLWVGITADELDYVANALTGSLTGGQSK
jgi:dTDP-4-amino-4,6-dideoxygalactose transaminase